MPWYFHWYETDTGLARSRTYRTQDAAEKERTAARAWGWDSKPARVHQKPTGKNHQAKVEYVVAYTRTRSAVAAAEVKRQADKLAETRAGLSQAQARLNTALGALHDALVAARTAEANPLTLEARVLTAMQQVIRASASLTRQRQQVVRHYQAMRSTHRTIKDLSPLIQEMRLPAADEVETGLQQVEREGAHESQRAETLAPALAAQERVVAAVRLWQEAVEKRWRAQRAYLPAERWWEYLFMRLEANRRRTPAIAVSRADVLTRVLPSAEVGPHDEGWRQAEAAVETTETALRAAIAARDGAVAEVAQAFAVTL